MQTAQNKKRKWERRYDSDELIYMLILIRDDDRYVKPNRLAKFTVQEALFIRDIIFRKRKGLLFFYLADHLMNNTIIRKMPMFNAPSMKKLRFLNNLISGAKSAKEAAVKAGYSPRTAKQQASRTLRQIQGFKRWS